MAGIPATVRPIGCHCPSPGVGSETKGVTAAGTGRWADPAATVVLVPCVGAGVVGEHVDPAAATEDGIRAGGSVRPVTGIPLIVTTPTDRAAGATRRDHALLRPTRRERRERRREKVRRRRTVFGRHPKSTVALVVLLLLMPVWLSAGSAATDQAMGNTVGARLTEWVRDHGGGGLVTWAENTWYT